MTRGPDRRDEIAAFVAERGHVRVEELVERFGVSRMTIHRHVDQLAQRGMLHKLHGAVSAQPSGIYESLFRYRSGMACLLYTSPSPRDQRGSRMPSSA